MSDLSPNALQALAPAGYYVGLRILFAFPAAEVNELPTAWVELYARERFFLADPALRWSVDHSGAIRWSDLSQDDPAGMTRLSAVHGMRHGAVAAFREPSGLRSYGLFYRDDRDYEEVELEQLAKFIAYRHRGVTSTLQLTRAEIAVLKAIKQGTRLKQIAHDFGVSQGAIKQRLRNARLKLDAATGAQAAIKASEAGLI
ncbi:MAG: autoinducer binding domain-containing protein [Limimaricola soesokkakensis]|uniref:autoinducer binding domain-containing protein n=1 Tax=Limimaricola soesokkakensis TaxID=1343159 RepID=UPI004059D218